MKTNLKAIPSIFHLDSNGEANGEVEEYCSKSCASSRQSYIERKLKHKDFKSGMCESRHLLDGAQCTSCGTLISDVAKGETVADLITWLHDNDIDTSMPISCTGTLGFSLKLDGGTVIIDVGNANSTQLMTVNQMCDYIYKATNSKRNIDNKLLFSVCGESGFSARIDSGYIAIDSADISFD
tara:strand:+ start:806 stop:1351 length:546 start_codon:yes stop_codon:yes gene_type:complete